MQLQRSRPASAKPHDHGASCVHSFLTFGDVLATGRCKTIVNKVDLIKCVRNEAWQLDDDARQTLVNKLKLNKKKWLEQFAIKSSVVQL